MSKVNSIPSTICLNSIKGSTSGQEEKMTDLKTKERMTGVASSKKNKTASWTDRTDSHIYRNKAIKVL